MPSTAVAQDEASDPLIVQKTFWISEMNRKLPNQLCAPDEDFVRCYPVTEDQCVQHMREWSMRCLNDQRLPAKLNVVEEGAEAGDKAGLCLGQKFMDLYGKKRKDIDECKFRRDGE